VDQPEITGEDILLRNRWRLLLGRFSRQRLGECSEPRMEQALDFLYGREYRGRSVMDAGSSQQGGQGDSVLMVPEWLKEVKELFPAPVSEKLVAHALDRYGIEELLADRTVLEQLTPDVSLLRRILAMKGLMKPEVLETARRVVRKVVEEIRQKLESRVRRAIMGKRSRASSSPIKCAKNFDFRRTACRNLRNYDRESGTLGLERIYFHSNVRRFNPWHIVLCIDESGSMMDSVIYSAVMAGIFASLPALSVTFVIFDTNVVDLSDRAGDPVETLMSVQLGGGTDIGKALAYCEGKLTNPANTILVLVSDLCDGCGYTEMYRRTASMIESGVRFICLTALDQDCVGVWDTEAAGRMADLGAHVSAMTPEHLAAFVGEVIAR